MMPCEAGHVMRQGVVQCDHKARAVHVGVCRRCELFRGPWPEFLAVLDRIQARPCGGQKKHEEARA